MQSTQTLIYIGAGFTAVAAVTVVAAAVAAVAWTVRTVRAARKAFPAAEPPSCPCLFTTAGAGWELTAAAPGCCDHEYRPGGAL